MANNSRVDVTLGFKSDMSQINKDLNSLTEKLRAIGQGKGILGGEQAITKEMNIAMNSASKLSTIMQKCRMDNGKLDIAAFKREMDNAGMTAKSLANDLKALGPQGVSAFNEISKAIMTAQVPMKKTQGMLADFAVTLKNTAKWQISSTLLHGFMSSVSGAYHYAQDLNESLNNIRIVSKQNTDQMADFAREANKAAKELSVTTTAYTDAALIFYQQGLKGEDVTSRTDVVAKMSNVTKDSVDEVSSYMTAIWNNFDDGSESLEHYADVITGLGAATASSSAEIAAGLEKFAAVADTVGLSYDYATSALATVVAQTRQSADTVGTAFKTLFARIEGLKLGETLEDGVDLNKYSQALEKIGVNVLNANGQLKNMDDILDDMGAKWNQIGREQQVALAQTVAGTRQYNQLVALMDNWDKVQENLQVARSSDGELQAQADIYAQSWEAAQKRVQAAWQTIYASLMDEDFFIALANGAEKLLNFIGKIIDALGGLKGLWPVLMTGFMKLFGGDIGLNLGNFVTGIKTSLDEAKGIFKNFKDEFAKEDITLNVKVNNNAMAVALEQYHKLIDVISEAQQAVDKNDVVTMQFLEDIRARVLTAINAEQSSAEDLIKAAEKLEQLIQNYQSSSTFKSKTEVVQPQPESVTTPQPSEQESNYVKIMHELSNSIHEVTEKTNELKEGFGETGDAITSTTEKASDLKQILVDINNPSFEILRRSLDDAKISFDGFAQLYKELTDGRFGANLGEMGVNTFEKDIAQLDQIMKSVEEKTISQNEAANQINQILDSIATKCNDYEISMEKTENLTEQDKQHLEEIRKIAGLVANCGEAYGKHQQNNNIILEETEQKIKSINENTEKGIVNVQKFGQAFQQSMMNASRFATALTQINNIVDKFNDSSKDLGEAFLESIPSLLMILLNLKSGVSLIGDMHAGLVKLFSGELLQSGIKKVNVKLTQEQAAAQEQVAASETVETVNEEAQEVLRSGGSGGSAAAGGVKGAVSGSAEGVVSGAAGAAGAAGGAGAGTAGGAGGTAGAGGLSGFLVALGGSAAAIAATAVIVAALVAGVAAYAIHKSNMKQLTREAEKAALKETEHLEKVNKTSEELDSINELSNSYDQLYSQINEGSITREEAKAQAIDLAAKYQDESLMILALKGSYKELEDQIRNTQAAKQEQLAKELEEGISYSKDNILAQAQKAAGSAKDDLGDKWDLGHGMGSDTQDAIGKLLEKENYKFEAGTKMLKEDWESMWEKATTDPEAFKEFQQEVTAAAAEGENAAIHLKEYISAAQESINSASDSVKKFRSLKLETAFTELYNGLDKAVDKAGDFFDFVNQVKSKAPDATDSEIIQMASSHANTQDMAVYGQTAMAVANQKGWDLDVEVDRQAYDAFVEELEKIDGDTVAVLGIEPELTGRLVDDKGHLHLDDNDIGITKEQIKNLGGVQKEKSEVYKIQDAMNKFDPSKAAKGQGWSKKDKSELASIEGLNLNASDANIFKQLRELEIQHIETLEKKKKVADDLAKSMADLAEANKRYQATNENDKFINQADMSKETEESITNRANNAIKGEVAEKDTEWQESFIRDDLRTTDFSGDAEKNLIEPLIEAREAGEGLAEQLIIIADFYADKLPDSGEELDKALEGVYKELGVKEVEHQKLIENSIKKRKAGTKALDEYKSRAKALSSVQAALSANVDAEGDSLENLQKNLDATSAELDEIQAAYKQLHAAMQEYNEGGTLSLDTIQALTKLGPQFVQYLVNEKGELELNEAAIKAATEARFREMEAEQAQILLKQLKIIADAKEVDSEYLTTVSAYASATALEEMGGTMDYVIAQANRISSTLPGATEAINGIANAARAFKQIYDAGTKGINTNFPKFMGVSSKGGGGSKKEKEKKDLKEYADEFDRFYPFQKVIDDLADAISDLAKEQEHMAGGELVGALHKQNRLLQEQKKAYQELAKEQKKYQKEMQMDLAKYGMSFDVASGNIVNYAQSTQAMLDQYNAAIEKYNKSAQSDADKKTLEAVEKEYEKFKKLVSNYQGILTEIQDTENNLDDIYYETIANNLKEFEVMVQVKLDIGEAQRMVNDFISKINKNFKTLRKSTEEWMEMFDTALKNAHTYIDGDLGTINVDMDALNKVKGAIDSGDYGHEGAMFASETEAIVKYKELAEQLKDDANDLYELYKQAWEDYIDAVDESIEEWQEIIDNFDDVNDTLDHYEKVIELLHGHQDTDQGYEELIALYDKQMELQLAKQATLRRQVETMQKEYDELIAQGAKENDKDVKAIRDAINDANKELQGSLESYIETMNKAFSKKAEKYGKDRMKAALGFDPDEFTESWNRAKKAQEGYYDVNERIYQLDKINRKFNEAIDNTKNIKLQKQLIKLRDEENERLEKKKVLSEADVAIAEKKLAVEQAKIALEEAQNNKSQLRLQRDSQGNWNYQFVANEDEIEDKQQALIDASYDLYETTKKAGEDCVNTLRELFTSWGEEYNAIMTDMSLNDEQRMIKLQELDTYYTGLINQNAESLRDYKVELGEATANLLLTSYELDKDNYNNMTEEQKAITDELKEHNIEDIADIATANDEEYTRIQQKAEEVSENTITWWNNLKEAVEIDTQNMEDANNELYTRLQQLISEYDDAIRRSEEASGFAWSNVKQAIDDTGRAIDEVSDKVEDCIRRTQYLSDFRSRVMEIESAWYSVKDSITSALNELDDYLEKLLDVKEMQEAVKREATEAAAGDIGRGVNTSGNGGSGGGSGYGSSKSNPQPIQHYITSVYTQSAGGGQYNLIGISDSGAEKKLEGPKFYTTDEIQRKKSQWVGRYTSYDTGGYTGNWNADSTTIGDKAGKLAVLHQKELILNQSDTKNILDAVQMVRDMNNSSNNQFASYLADTICKGADAVAKILEDGIHYVTENMTSTTYQLAQAIRENGSRQFDQTVHIDASFPAATDRYEIEAAFDNLLNVASQRMLNSDTTLLSN